MNDGGFFFLCIRINNETYLRKLCVLKKCFLSTFIYQARIHSPGLERAFLLWKRIAIAFFIAK